MDNEVLRQQVSAGGGWRGVSPSERGPTASFPPTHPQPHQVEELKNKNLMLRAQLRQHGVEIVIKNESH